MTFNISAAYRTAEPLVPLHMAVPLPCDPPRRPGWGSADRRRRQRPEGERAMRFPGAGIGAFERFPVMEPGTC